MSCGFVVGSRKGRLRGWIKIIDSLVEPPKIERATNGSVLLEPLWTSDAEHGGIL